ncbi:MAG TPA: hypothetical protein VKI19_00180 [Acidimicrobiales bacterium]|nr:hypothetical protein [Acidimicrobiales bacterium]
MVVFLIGAAVAVAAAARSTWSPCGLSMLSSITPFAERARGHRYTATAAWFVLGATAGGAVLGAAAAGPAAALGHWDRSHQTVAAAMAVTAALIDAGWFGPVLPLVRRQVDPRWLDRYRPWVYASGFGWQIGLGVATYLMTAGVLLVVGLAVLSGSPVTAVGIGAVFGLARGSTVFLTAGSSAPAALRRLHGRLDRLELPVRAGVVAVQLGAAALIELPVGLAAAALMGAGAVVRVAVRGRRLPVGHRPPLGPGLHRPRPTPKMPVR